MKPGFDLSTTADAELIGAYLEGSLPDDQMLAVEDLIDDSPQLSSLVADISAEPLLGYDPDADMQEAIALGLDSIGIPDIDGPELLEAEIIYDDDDDDDVAVAEIIDDEHSDPVHGDFDDPISAIDDLDSDIDMIDCSDI